MSEYKTIKKNPSITIIIFLFMKMFNPINIKVTGTKKETRPML